MKRKREFVLLASLVFLLPHQAGFSQEGDPQAGAKKNAQCQGCHGLPGFRTAYPKVYTVPKIGGQSVQYLVNALKAYRSGSRTHPGMRAIAASLTDLDIADLAAYYAEIGKISAANKKD